MEQNNYRIDFEIKGKLLSLMFSSYNDYTFIHAKALEDFIVFFIREHANAKALMGNDECALFAKNIHLYKNGEKYAICSIEERSIQVYP